MVIEVFNPAGATEITTLHAPRLDTLEGKTIYLLSIDAWQAHRTFPLIRELLQERFPTATIVPHTELFEGTAQIDSDEVADLIEKKGGQAVIIGNAG